MEIVKVIKHAVWTAISTAIVVGIFWAGYWVGNIKNNTNAIQEIKKNTVTVDLWKTTDEKTDDMLVMMKGMNDKIDDVAHNINVNDIDSKTNFGSVNTKIAVIDERQKTMKADLEEHIELDRYNKGDI
jgi:hypothetical protein